MIEGQINELMAQGVELWPDDGELRCRGPKRLLTPELFATLRAQKEEILDALAQGSEIFPLAYGQWVFWFEEQMAGASSAYNVSLAMRIHSPLDAEVMQRAIQMLVNRHPMLRTTFPTGSEPRQQVHQYQKAAFEVFDVGGQAWEAVEALVIDAHQRPFDLAQGPVFRADLFTRRPEDHILLCSAHHIVCDGLSLGILIDELPRLYAIAATGRGEPLVAPEARYADYVTWQQEMLESEGDQLLGYWRTQLAGAAPTLNLQTDFQRPSRRTYDGASAPIDLSPALTDRLKALARAQGVTVYMLLLAAYQVLLFRYSGQDDILVDSTMAGRSEARFRSIVGNFFAPVVLRANLADNPTFEAFLGQTRRTAIDALTHQEYPFALLVEELQPERDPARPPLAQVSFGLHKPYQQSQLWNPHVDADGQETVKWGDWQVTPLNVGLLEGMYELDLEIVDLADRMAGSLIYNTSLFAEPTMRRMAANFLTLLEGILDNPIGRVQDLPLLAEEERRLQLVAWNQSADEGVGEPIDDRCVHELFEDQAHRTPDAVALVFEQASDSSAPISLTYRQLNQRANQLAHHLRALGVGPGMLVGLSVERSVEMVVGIYAILKAGGAYVPIDPTYPTERIQQMIAEAQISVLLTQETLRGQLPPSSATLVSLDGDSRLWQEQASENLGPAATPSDLIYAIFTSGSTGKPKGAGVYHRGFTNLVQWYANDLAMTADDRLLLLTSFSFDLTQKNFFAPLIGGGTFYLSEQPYFDPRQICRFVKRHEISWINCTPSMFYHLAEAESPGASLVSLHTVVLGGEPIAMDRLSGWLARRAIVPRIINSYGPTECTDVCAAHLINTEIDTSSGNLSVDLSVDVPIGRPIANVQLVIVDGQLQPVPLGCVGELCIGGVGVGAGYLNDPALTQSKFMPNPFAAVNANGTNGLLYRTGDSAKFLANGDILYRGRIDNQVKLRGMRVELGEIEATLVAHPAVLEAVVVLRRRQPNDERLVAYVVLDRNSSGTADSAMHSAMSTAELRAFVEDRLPAYMVPANFVVMDRLPLTPSGKVDRNALPEADAVVDAGGLPEPERAPEPVSSSSRAEIEQTIAALWASELGLQDVGLNESFFSLGGDSFSAIRIVSALKGQGYSLPLRQVFEQPTVAGLAAVLADQKHPIAPVNGVNGQANGAQTNGHAPQAKPALAFASKRPDTATAVPPLVPIQPHGSKTPFFCVHPVMGVTYPYYQLAQHLGDDQPFYALQSVGLEPGKKPDSAIERMATRYIEALRTVQPHGPYCLGGWSFGSWVAYEMAVQLLAEGESVALLAVIDTLALTREHGLWSQIKGNWALTGVIARNVWPYVRPYLHEFRALSHSSADAVPGSEDSLWRAAIKSLQVFAANNRATFAYRPRPHQYTGPVTVLRTQGQAGSVSHDLCWGALCQSDVDVIDVPGNHMTVLREPQVAAVASQLQALLDHASVDTTSALSPADNPVTVKATAFAAPAATSTISVATVATTASANAGAAFDASRTLSSTVATSAAVTGTAAAIASERKDVEVNNVESAPPGSSPMTGDDYLESLRDGREVWIYGERVADVTTHPAFRNQARMVARLYDMLHNPEMQALVTTKTDTGSGGFTHPYFRASYNQAEQLASRDALAAWHRVGFGWMGRAPDYMAGLLGMLGANAELYEPYDGNARRWYSEFQERMPYVNHALVNPPVDRHRSPEEVSDVYIHVVRETDAGIVVSGAKNITTNAALTNYSFVAHDGGAPAKSREFAATFLLPVNTPGVKMICRPSYEMRAAEGGSPFDYPLSGRFDENDAIFILDNVLVPWENVLIYGDLEKYNKHMHNTGFYPRSGLQSATRLAVKLDLIAGLLLKATEATGVEQFRGVQVNIGEVLTWRHLFWTLSDAMASTSVPHNGVVIPKIEHMMAHRMLMSTAYPRVKEIVSQLVASGLIFHPSGAKDFQTPELRPYLDKYMRGSNSDATERAKLMKTLWDAMGTEFGGRHELYERNNLGNHEAVRLHVLFQGMADGTEESLKQFADLCLDEVDLDGWTSPDLINPGQ